MLRATRKVRGRAGLEATCISTLGFAFSDHSGLEQATCTWRGSVWEGRLWFQAEVNIDMTVFTLVTLLLLAATHPAAAYSQGGKGACGEEPREGEACVSGSHSRGHVVRKLGTSPVRGHWRRGPGPLGQCRELGRWGSGLGSTGLGLCPSSATDWQWDSRTVGEWGGKDFINCQVLCKGER